MPASLPWNDTEESEVYQASAIHQLHCLDLLRISMIAFTKGEVSPYAQLGHMMHCFDIIRQGILCAGRERSSRRLGTSVADKCT